MRTSTAYEKLREQEAERLLKRLWPHAPRWRNRVGLPRLAAEAAVGESSGLLRSINLSTFRNDEEIADKLTAAREAVHELNVAIARDNWNRFKGGAR